MIITNNSRYLEDVVIRRTLLFGGVVNGGSTVPYALGTTRAVHLYHHLDTRNKAGIPGSLRPVLKGIAEDMSRSTDFDLFYLLKATPQDVKPIPVPEGMKFRAISTAEIQIIDSTWKYTTKGTYAYTQYRVQHFPSVFLVTEKGDYVGHMIGCSYGTMGMLHVSPEFRRKGYAKVIVSQLAQREFDRGEDAYVLVEEENSVSRNLHVSLGFRVVQVSGLKLGWMSCAPQSCCPKPGTK